MARLEGKVAFITGAARGQGRSHAVRLAEEGADIIAVDIGSPTDLGQTVKEVEALDRRILASQADVRDYAALKAALGNGVALLGRLDIVVANAGIVSFGTAEELTEQAWRDVIDVDLTGVWLTVKAAIPHLRAAAGGSIIIINSGAGLKGSPNTGHYAAAKHGLVGLMQSLANELAPDMVRVNSVHPGAVDNDMLHNQALYHQLLPDHPGDITREEIEPVFRRLNALPIPWVESVGISNAVLFLGSDDARYIPAPASPSTPANSSSDTPPAPTHTRERQQQ
jgi:(+)-trans-carveol dehydrogenase